LTVPYKAVTVHSNTQSCYCSLYHTKLLQFTVPHKSVTVHSTTLSCYCSLYHSKLLLFPQTPTKALFFYLTSEGIRENLRQILNCCSAQSVYQNVKVIPISIPHPLRQCSTVHRLLSVFTVLILLCFGFSCFFLFYVAIFCLILYIGLYREVTDTFFKIIISFLRNYFCHYNMFTLFLFGIDLFLFIIFVNRCHPDDGRCGQPKYVAVHNVEPVFWVCCVVCVG
jgi:hypothetical protein